MLSEEVLWLPNRGNERYLEVMCLFLNLSCSRSMLFNSVEEWVTLLSQPQAFPSAYKDARELRHYKGVLHIPYSWSTLAFWEFLQAGLVVIVPTARFFLQLTSSCAAWDPSSSSSTSWMCKDSRIYHNGQDLDILWFQDFTHVTSVNDLLLAEWWSAPPPSSTAS